ncbi:HpcH/HpaI aldolase/citrate lyase family protein [Xylophilus sp. ASV27]|uniref:HpcH/HpaI aldolase/citrate lyase family protein n=1 Tax=Xylophilus sp. ASV27 TaxID=2795129 RepID=UPI0018EDEA6D|nr:CoA ester lyase [Xylophilus sp. ASV27]
MKPNSDIWPLSSLLFLPAHKIEWARKVSKYKPSAVILDLEDAVPTNMKAEAREIAREAIAVLAEAGIAPFVRVNGWDFGGPQDVERITVPGLAGVMLAKADSAEEVRALDLALTYGEGKSGMARGCVAIVPLPETSNGLYEGRALARASQRCMGLAGMVGPVNGDVARAAGFLPTLEGMEQLYLASKTVLDSRAGGAMYPKGSIVGMRIDDLDAVRMLCQRAKQLGFTGAVLIHPSHVAIANEVFAPSAEEIDYAQGVIEAVSQAQERGDGAVQFRGQMVDYAMLPHAHDVLRRARRMGLTATERANP